MTEPQKLTLPQLAMLEWLCERPQGRRIYGSSEGRVIYYDVVDQDGERPRITRVYPLSSTQSAEARKADQEFLIRMGGRSNIDHHPLWKAGFVTSFNSLGHSGDKKDGKSRYQRFIEQYANDPFHYSEHASVVTKAGQEYWERIGRDQLAAARQKIAQAEAAVGRLVLIGVQSTVTGKLPEDLVKAVPEGMPLGLPSIRIMRPYAVARVIKETTQRLYVRDVEILPTPYSGWAHSPISGNEPNQYVSVDNILVDHANRVLINRYLAVEAEFRDDYDRITTEMVRTYLPAASEYYSRLRQKESERADLLRELLSEQTSDDQDDLPKP